MSDTFTSPGDQAGWIGSLTRFVSEAEVPSLRDRVLAARGQPLQTDAAQSEADHNEHDAPLSPSGRMLAFYIDRAQEMKNAGPQAMRAAAQHQLDDIHDRLSARISQVLPGTVPVADSSEFGVSEPAAVPKPAPEFIPESDPEPEPAAQLTPSDPTLADAIRLVYTLILKRSAVDEEIHIWQQNFQNGVTFPEFILAMYEGDEAKARQQAERVGSELSNGEFVVNLYRVVMGRGCDAYELEAVRNRLEAGGASRQGLLAEFFSQALEAERSGADHAVHDGLSCSIMGTPRFLTLEEWQQKAKDPKPLEDARKNLRISTPFVLSGEPDIRVSAIASLYCGGDFIEQFMDNITSQSCFDRHCELIIIDADSPEDEAETIHRYLDKHPSIVYKRMNSRIGIYEAWNVGVEMARGRYLTNTNLDDLRREDSLEIQAGALDALPFVDVVYQDFYYSFDPKLSWEEIAAFGYKSDLPIVTRFNMLRFNSPHNAPMWRKSLHDELGLFDANFKSAGDYEFWLRCLAAEKTFYKINEPHVVYYQNPKGLSTRADTRGIIEAKAIGQKYTPLLLPPTLTSDFDTFLKYTPVSGIDTTTDLRQDRHVAIQKTLRNLARGFKQEET